MWVGQAVQLRQSVTPCPPPWWCCARITHSALLLLLVLVDLWLFCILLFMIVPTSMCAIIFSPLQFCILLLQGISALSSSILRNNPRSQAILSEDQLSSAYLSTWLGRGQAVPGIETAFSSFGSSFHLPLYGYWLSCFTE